MCDTNLSCENQTVALLKLQRVAAVVPRCRSRGQTQAGPRAQRAVAHSHPMPQVILPHTHGPTGEIVFTIHVAASIMEITDIDYDTQTDLCLLRQSLLLKPPLLLLGPLSQPLPCPRDLRLGFLPGASVVPQQLLDIRRVLALSSWRVGYSVVFTLTGHSSRNLGGRTLLGGRARMFARTQTASSPVRLETLLPLLLQTLHTSTVSGRTKSVTSPIQTMKSKEMCVSLPIVQLLVGTGGCLQLLPGPRRQHL